MTNPSPPQDGQFKPYILGGARGTQCPPAESLSIKANAAAGALGLNRHPPDDDLGQGRGCHFRRILAMPTCDTSCTLQVHGRTLFFACKVFAPNLTKMFHVKHFWNNSKQNEPSNPRARALRSSSAQGECPLIFRSRAKEQNLAGTAFNQSLCGRLSRSAGACRAWHQHEIGFLGENLR